jgi:hypothetical protein
MNIRDTLNPWGALAEARETISKLTNELAVEQIRRQNVVKDMKLRQRIIQSQFERLEDLLRTAHFRDPKTGRIGPRGRRFT